jgi:CopA family copper-resistance protein
VKTLLMIMALFLSCVSSIFAAERTVILVVGHKTVYFAGSPSQAIAVNNQIPAPTLHFKEGDHVTLNVFNRLDQETAIHWHGMLVPWQMDGVMGVSQRGIPAGSEFHYQFTLHQSGTYWYHAHAGLQEQQGLYGAFLIDPLKPSHYQYTKDYVIVLSDWSNTKPDQILANLKKEGDYYSPKLPLQPSLLKFIRDYRKASVAGRKLLINDYKMMQQMRMSIYDISDVAYDAYLLNGKPASTPWTASVKVGDVVRLRFIGAGGSTIFHVKIPDTTMQMVHVEGNDVEPYPIKDFRIAPGETYDVLVRIEKSKPYIIYAESIDTSGAALGALFTAPNQHVDYKKIDPFPEPLPVTREMMSTMMMSEMNQTSPSMKMKMRSYSIDKKPRNNSSGSMSKIEMKNLKATNNATSQLSMTEQMKMNPGMKMDGDMSMNHPMYISEQKKSTQSIATNRTLGVMDAPSPSRLMQIPAKNSRGIKPKKPMGKMNASHPAGMSDNMQMNDGMQMDHSMHMSMATEPTINGDNLSSPNSTFPMKMSSGMSMHTMTMDEQEKPSEGITFGTKYQDLTAAVKTNDPTKPVTKIIKMELFGYMDRYIWFINGEPEYRVHPIILEPGKRYRFIFTNPSMMNHPMHIHGHWFILRNGHGSYDPLLHTISIPPGGTVTADVDTDASGQWFFHCHLLYHMMTGMSRVFQYETLIEITKGEAKPENIAKQTLYHNRPIVRIDEIRPIDPSLVQHPMAHPMGLYLSTFLEVGEDSFHDVQRLTYKALYGPDYNKLELFTNDAEIKKGTVENADIDIFYWHLIDQFWAIKGGANYFNRPAQVPYWQPGIGLEGLMPYFIDTDVRGYYHSGSAKLDIELSRDSQMTNNFFIRAGVRGIFASKTVVPAEMGSGLNQTRYVIRPFYRLMPGINIFAEYEHEQDYGSFRSIQVKNGESASQNTLTFGISMLL